MYTCIYVYDLVDAVLDEGGVDVCMYICIYVHMYICIHACIYVHVHMYTCIYA